MSTYSERIKELRKRKKMTQIELSEVTGISRTTLFRYEKGETKISTDNLTKLAEALDTTPEYILKGKSEESLKILTKTFKKLTSYNQNQVIGFAEERLRSQSEKIIKFKPKWEVEVNTIPLSAGTGMMILDNMETESRLVDKEPPASYDEAWEVRGDSMIPLFHDGQIIYTDKISPERVREHDFLAICMDDEFYVKKAAYNDEGRLIFRSLNEKYDDIIPGDEVFFQIIGRVVLN